MAYETTQRQISYELNSLWAVVDRICVDMKSNSMKLSVSCHLIELARGSLNQNSELGIECKLKS